LDQSSFLKLEVMVSSWHKQFPLENCCTCTLSAALLILLSIFILIFICFLDLFE